MRNRTKLIAAAAAAAAALTAGGTAAAMAATAGAATGAPVKTVPAAAAAAAAAKKPGPAPGSPSEQQGHDALVAVVAAQLHVSQERASAALAPLFAAGAADPSSPAFAAIARSLGVSSQRLAAALDAAKESLGRGAPPAAGGAKSKS